MGDSSELIDSEDGSMLQCAICSEALAGSKIAVKTLCSHFFHEDCLAHWCSDHLNCPLCRRPVGETDEARNDPLNIGPAPNHSIVVGFRLRSEIVLLLKSGHGFEYSNE